MSAAVLVFARKWMLRLAYALFYPLPVQDKVVLASSSASRARGNLKAIGDELSRREDLSARVVVHTHRSSAGLSGKLATLWAAIVGEYHLATSRVFIVDDYYFPIYVIKPKKATTIIQTWHACGAFKKVGYSVADRSFGASKELLKQVRIHSNYTYCLVASRSAIPYYSEAFGQPEETFVVLGIPRTDVLFQRNEGEIGRKVRARYGIPEGKKVILYAPTFRGDSAHVAEYGDYLDLDLLRSSCGDEYVVLVKLHPFVRGAVDLGGSGSGFAFDVSDYGDINELMLMSDVLITDYSSAIFEYSLLGKPMLFFAPDYVEYEAERGFYFDYETGIPGPLFTSSASLAEHLATGELDTSVVQTFRERSFDIADGRASARVVDELVVPAFHG